MCGIICPSFPVSLTSGLSLLLLRHQTAKPCGRSKDPKDPSVCLTTNWVSHSTTQECCLSTRTGAAPTPSWVGNEMRGLIRQGWQEAPVFISSLVIRSRHVLSSAVAIAFMRCLASRSQYFFGLILLCFEASRLDMCSNFLRTWMA